MPELPPKTADLGDPDKLRRFKANPFLDGPTEFLIKCIADEINNVPQFSAIFLNFIDPYMRMDYPVRALPALRIYNKSWTKDAESWFINGDVTLDCIWPPSIRREETQSLPDTVSSALCQQFRRPTFFNTLVERVPGLNELGKVFGVEKSLGFEWQDALVPLTQITVNFRLDLRVWDKYLEQTNRTKDSPFAEVLGNLESIATVIKALRDDETTDVQLGLVVDTTPEDGD